MKCTCLFHHRTIFPFVCPNHPVTWAGSRAGPPLSECVSTVKPTPFTSLWGGCLFCFCEFCFYDNVSNINNFFSFIKSILILIFIIQLIVILQIHRTTLHYWIFPMLLTQILMERVPNCEKNSLKNLRNIFFKINSYFILYICSTSTQHNLASNILL